MEALNDSPKLGGGRAPFLRCQIRSQVGQGRAAPWARPAYLTRGSKPASSRICGYAKECVMSNFKRCGVAPLVVALLAAPATGAQTVPAGDTPRFVGTWRLISDTQTGIMIYDSLGNMAAQVM